MTRRRDAGFTLIEILVVVVILGILGAVVAPNLLSRPDQARVTAAKTTLQNIGNALDMYRLDNFTYPSSDQGLEALVTRPSGFPEAKNWNPDGYIDNYMDPWGNEYVYVNTGTNFELLSYGADGAQGGDGTGADISYADLP
ncbi:MAG: type II secretion system major pseudopilin GspG [Pseudomonadota bacterium]